MENFFKIRAEKQEHIINAAYTAFGRQGYKKASVADIADAAGIAKGMVTYYFGSKKNLYLYLYEFGQKTIVEKVLQHFRSDVTDFFDKIRMATEIKVAVAKEYPGLQQFFVSMVSEQDEEVAADIQGLANASFQLGYSALMDNTDFSKFREDIDPQKVARLVHWAGNGVLMDLQLRENADKLDEYVQEYYDLLDMMKAIFYKEVEEDVKS